MINIVFTGQREGFAGLARTGGAADAMHIIFRILRQVIIDHMADIFNMDATRGHIGCNQDFDFAILELLH